MNKGLEEIGKAILQFTNLATVLSLINLVLSSKINPLFAILILYLFIIFYIIGYTLINIGGGKNE